MKTPARLFAPVRPYPHRSKARAISFSLSGITALVLAALVVMSYTTIQNVPVSARSGPSTSQRVSKELEAQVEISPSSILYVTQIEPAALTGDNIPATYKNMARGQVQRTDRLRIVVSATGVILLMGLAYLLTHIGPGMAGPGSLGV